MAAARVYDRLATQLLERGTPIGVHDAMIAVHAITAERRLVSNNLRHFQRVRGLRVETWAEAAPGLRVHRAVAGGRCAS